MGNLEHGTGCVCDAGHGCILDGGAPEWAAAQLKGGDPISVAPVAPVSERRWCINSLGAKVWETDLEYTQRTGDPAPVAPMRPGAEYVCDPGYVPGSITDLLREMTAKAFAPVKLPTTHAKGRAPKIKQAFAYGVDLAKPGSDMTVAVMARYDHERGVMVTESITAGEFYASETQAQYDAALKQAAPRTHAACKEIDDWCDAVSADKAMLMRDAVFSHLRILEPYLDIDGREIVGPGRSARRSWLNTSTTYRSQCMVGQ